MNRERHLSDLQHGEHACLVDGGSGEPSAAAVGFLFRGLVRGDRCIVLSSAATGDRLCARLAAAGVDLEHERRRGALQDSDRLGPQGLAAGNLDDVLAAQAAAAAADGFSGLRLLVDAADVHAARGGLKPRRLFEASLDRLVATHRAAVLCVYDPSRLDGTAASAARFHVRVLAGGPRSPQHAPHDPYRVLVETIPHMVWMTRADGYSDYLNQRGAERLGFPPDVVYGWEWLRLLHPDDMARSRAVWEEAVRSGSHYRNEYRVRHRDGSYRWYLAQAVPLRAANDSIERWIGTWTDIDDLKQAEASLARDALLLASVRDAVVVTDLAGSVTYWNEGATRLFGWAAAEMMGRPLVERFPEPVRPTLAALARRIAAGAEWSGEFQDYRKNGSRVWIDARVARITDAHGRPFAILGISHDITARRQAEAELRLRDRAIQAVTQGILITDPAQPENPVIYASPGFERLTGYTSEEVLGRSCRFLQGEGTDPAALAALRAAVHEGRPCTVELLNYKKDGSSFWNELSISPLRDVDGRVTHFAGVQTDVTERRMLEEQYRQAQKMEAVGRLAGGVAHDINNLLTIMTGSSELLLHSETLPESARDLLEGIRAAGERSAALTRQLLAFGRKQVLAPEVLDLNEVVRQTGAMLRRVIGEDIELVTDLDPALDHVYADPGQLEQVLLNLAVNARDAMPAGGRLTIHTANLAAGEQTTEAAPKDARVLLRVSDTGVGMSDTVRQRVFEPFFTTKAPGMGTGLGLAVVHGIVVQSGGRIDVESRPGRGSTFTIHLPRVDRAPRPAAPPVAGPLTGGSETILLVEDEDQVRRLLRRILQGCGYTVLEAARGEEALRIAAERGAPIDLLATDVVMPGLGGRQVAERLCALHPETKVLYLSGYTDDAIVRHGVSEEQVNFLQKPFTPAVLTRKVREILG